MSNRGNEATVCDVVMRYLERRCTLTAEDVYTTENDGTSDPESRVDRRFRLGLVSYAMEHTIVEPYEGEALDWAHRRNLTPDGRRILPPDIDESSFERFVRAFSSKHKKLKRCQSLGMRTALVLESEHIVHSPYCYAEMMDGVPPSFLVGVDTVYLVETGDKNVWHTWLLMSDGLFMRPSLDGRWPDPVAIERYGERDVPSVSLLETGERRGVDA